MLLRWHLPQQFVPLWFLTTRFFSLEKEKWWGRWASGSSEPWKQPLWTNPTASPGRSFDRMVFAYRRSSWGWGHEIQDKRGVTIRKTWPRAAGEKLSLHIWVTRVWMLPSYLTSTAQFCDDQNLKFNQSMNWTGLALFVIFTPVSSLGCKWKSFIALASGIKTHPFPGKDSV